MRGLPVTKYRAEDDDDDAFFASLLYELGRSREFCCISALLPQARHGDLKTLSLFLQLLAALEPVFDGVGLG